MTHSGARRANELFGIRRGFPAAVVRIPRRQAFSFSTTACRFPSQARTAKAVEGLGKQQRCHEQHGASVNATAHSYLKNSKPAGRRKAGELESGRAQFLSPSRRMASQAGAAEAKGLSQVYKCVYR